MTGGRGPDDDPDEVLSDAALLALAQARIETLCQQHGIRTPAVSLDLRGRNAGMAHWPQNLIRLNRELFRRNVDAFMDEVIGHELAHLWQSQLGLRGRPHGAAWQGLMARLGIPARRTHRFDLAAVPVRRQRRWRYACGCREHLLATVSHNRIRRGMAYRCLRCGGPLRFIAAAD